MFICIHVHVSLLQECSMAVGVGGGVLWACVCGCVEYYGHECLHVHSLYTCVFVTENVTGIYYVCVYGGGWGGIMVMCVCGWGSIMAMCICMYVHVSLLERMLQGCIMVMCVCMYVHVSLLERMLQGCIMVICVCMYVHVFLLDLQRMQQGCIMVMCVCMYVHVSLLERMLQGCIMVICVCMYVHVSLLERMLQGCIMVMCISFAAHSLLRCCQVFVAKEICLNDSECLFSSPDNV